MGHSSMVSLTSELFRGTVILVFDKEHGIGHIGIV